MIRLASKLSQGDPARRKLLAALKGKTAGAGRDILYSIIPERPFVKLYREMTKEGDEQSADLLREITSHLTAKLDLSNNEYQALNRLRNSVENQGRWDPALQRNNIFKAANLLGISLPSGMFASGRSQTASKKTIVVTDLKLRDGTVYPRGTSAEVVFSERTPSISEVIIEGRTLKLKTPSLYRYFRGFPKPPSMRTLEKWNSEGLGSTVTGQRGIEGDGYGSDGAPSWMLAMGLI